MAANSLNAHRTQKCFNNLLYFTECTSKQGFFNQTKCSVKVFVNCTLIILEKGHCSLIFLETSEENKVIVTLDVTNTLNLGRITSNNKGKAKICQSTKREFLSKKYFPGNKY